jgi:carboxylesterase type B
MEKWKRIKSNSRLQCYWIKVTDSIPIAFGPRIDAERENPFLPKDPIDIIESGSFNQVPLIIGVNANEGAFAIASESDFS